MTRLDGKVALVSGGARGIGEAIVRRFVSEGARVVFGDVLDAEGKAVAESLGDAALFVHQDVSQEDGWVAIIDTARDRYGVPRVLVNNAAINRPKPLLDITLDDYMDVVRINQVGTFLGMQKLAPVMRDAGGGSIINVSSINGQRGSSLLTAYSASKFAVTGMTQCAALELGPLGIRVNSIHPGGIDTPMTKGPEQGRRDVDPGAFFAGTPAGRVGEPAEVASMAVYLASDESDFVRGAAFVVDGGISTGLEYA